MAWRWSLPGSARLARLLSGVLVPIRHLSLDISRKPLPGRNREVRLSWRPPEVHFAKNSHFFPQVAGKVVTVPRIVCALLWMLAFLALPGVPAGPSVKHRFIPPATLAERLVTAEVCTELKLRPEQCGVTPDGKAIPQKPGQPKPPAALLAKMKEAGVAARIAAKLKELKADPELLASKQPLHKDYIVVFGAIFMLVVVSVEGAPSELVLIGPVIVRVPGGGAPHNKLGRSFIFGSSRNLRRPSGTD